MLRLVIFKVSVLSNCTSITLLFGQWSRAGFNVVSRALIYGRWSLLSTCTICLATLMCLRGTVYVLCSLFVSSFLCFSHLYSFWQLGDAWFSLLESNFCLNFYFRDILRGIVCWYADIGDLTGALHFSEFCFAPQPSPSLCCSYW